TDPELAAEIGRRLGAEVAPALDLVLETGSGPRRVRVAAGPGEELGRRHVGGAGAADLIGAGWAGLVHGGPEPQLSRIGAGFFGVTGVIREAEIEHRG